MAHQSERAWIEDVDRQNRERPVPGFLTLVGGSVQLDHELTDGDVIDSDGTEEYELQVFHTPGHSAGSISLLVQGERALFCGDAVPVYGDLPIYDDARQSVRSMTKLQAIRGIRHLLSSWDEPREGDAAYRQMDRALEYLLEIHRTVLAEAGEGSYDLMELSRKTALALGLPPGAVNPLLARTVAANLLVKDITDLHSGLSS
jgi:hydroxyacylglutathione hydrolase